MHARPVVYPARPAALPPVDRRAGSYVLRFARDAADLDAVQRLRFRVFNRELGEGLEESWRTGRDADAWDDVFHHIVIEHVGDRRPGTVVGSYRMQTGEMAMLYDGFYSACEFDLAGLPRDVLLDSVEIGRACVDPAHRNGRVIHLLWRGLAAYMLWNRKRHLFGCCSLPTLDPAIGLAAWRQLRAEGYANAPWRVAPRSCIECDVPPGIERPVPAFELPALFQSYLNLGAFVCGPPVVDADFRTIDFLVLLDTDRLDERTRRTFFRDLPEPPGLMDRIA